ncbi:MULTISPECIES: branched-chain amino acid ABC transporter substrate-binding protein [Kitasatospora]|uniref:Branched-chain amino acid transport system substrate-binding protein n=2 Tax=Kitasatospora TaxID=2063 RepID=A0ABT1IW44_9ACTN|nr:branched-chain amino acid ABC transporter substrate-binding protein [Kitasatospora paracochleata]MCP2309133.1 branched-chain amino acid transport system substrate-binding protein [Kitasatospora paracochleata]
MTGSTLPRASALGLVCALLLSGCGSVGLGSGSTITVTIGVDGPLTGKLADLGLGIRYSAELAVAKANAKNTVPGVKFVLDAKDDQADEQIARTNGEAFAADPKVMGVVGPLTSSGALEMAPVLSKAGLAEISPSNTAPALTWGADYRASGKKRQYATYFRTVTTDAVQGPLLARYAHSKLGSTRAAVVNDTKAYGTDLAAEFAGAFEEAGGKVAFRATIQDGTTDFTKLAAQIAAAKPDIVYYGGEHPEGGPLSAALKAAGVKAPMAGGDGLHTDGYLKAAGAAANGDLASQPGISVEGLASAFTYLDAYHAAGHKEEAGPFGPYAYDSTWALIQAVGRARQGKNGTELTGAALRKAVADALQEVSFFGVTGDVAFDEFGDTTNQVASIYQVQKGAWTAIVPFGRLRDF